jgi:hypothetical protein
MSGTRKTIADCERLLANIGKKAKFRVWRGGTSYPQVGGFFYIDVTAGRPRVNYVMKAGGESNVSPRLPTGKLCEWMRDYGVAGFREFLKYRRSDLR